MLLPTQATLTDSAAACPESKAAITINENRMVRFISDNKIKVAIPAAIYPTKIDILPHCAKPCRRFLLHKAATTDARVIFFM